MATDIQTVEAPPKPLTRRQQVFVSEYIKCWNASEAARKAGYSVRSAYARGHELVRNREIKALIQSKLDEVHMSADEALKLTADIARGDIGEFMSIGSMGFNLDLEAAQKAGKTNLLKKVTQKTVIDGKRDIETHIVDIELYDRQAALRDILSVHGRLGNRGRLERDHEPSGTLTMGVSTLFAVAAEIERLQSAAVERARAVDGTATDVGPTAEAE